MKITKEQLINTAKELNEILFVENDPQAIDFTAPLETVRTSIKEAAALLTAQDDLTIGTKQVLAELGVWIDDGDLPGQSDEAEITDVQDAPEITPEPEPVKTTPVAPKQTIADKMTKTPAGPKPSSKVPTPQDLVMAASNRQELVDLLNAYTDLKPLRTTHRSYKVDADLKAAMCILLNGGVITPVKSTPEKAPSNPDVKPIAKVKENTAPKNKKTGLGVIATIVNVLQSAGEAGITKDAILQKLVAQFPDRPADSLKNTINTQVPNRITKERFAVAKYENGAYYKV